MMRYRLWVEGPPNPYEETISYEDLELAPDASEEEIKEALDAHVELMISNEIDAGWAVVEEGAHDDE